MNLYEEILSLHKYQTTLFRADMILGEKYHKHNLLFNALF